MSISAGAITAADVRRVVAAVAFPAWDGAVPPDRIGLEVEFLPVWTSGGTRRASIADLVEVLDEAARCDPDLRPDSAYGGYVTTDGTRITFEPGGQVEVSTACQPDVATAGPHVAAVIGRIARPLATAGIALAAAGADLWHALEDVPQQLTHARYPAMHAYLAARGPAGPRMMRHTASLQVNLDAGDADTRLERWWVANLLAPFIVATFANSPGRDDRGDVLSTRACTWAQLDPTRTGVAAGRSGRDDDPVGDLVACALEADVLLVRRRGTAVPGTPGWRFGDWIRDGHPEHGRPTADDLRYHLSTLFHEVRPRGALEFRGIDSLPARWRCVPVVLLAGALYDAEARAGILRVLWPLRGQTDALLADAPRSGVVDASTCAIAVEVWSLARAGAARLADGYVDPATLRRTDEFLDRYTTRGRTPAHDLAPLLVADPERALRSVLEPVPTLQGVAR